LNILESYNEAIKACDKATKLDPNNSYGYLIKCEALLHLNLLEDAIETINKAIELNRENVIFQNIKRDIEKEFQKGKS
jgi:tetratricopeptide (TPR) repeat protein